MPSHTPRLEPRVQLSNKQTDNFASTKGSTSELKPVLDQPHWNVRSDSARKSVGMRASVEYFDWLWNITFTVTLGL